MFTCEEFIERSLFFGRNPKHLGINGFSGKFGGRVTVGVKGPIDLKK